MNRFAYSLMIGACVAALPAAARAEELWTPHLAGIQNGYATGALPPPGFYYINTTDYASTTQYGPNGSATGTKVTGLVEVPEVGWVTGWNVLGADYAVLIAQPWDRVDVKPAFASADPLGPVYGTTPAISQSGLFATFLTPGYLSWHLPDHFFLAARTDVFIPDGGWKNPLSGHGVAGHLNAIDFFAVQPSVAVSYLNDGWNFSAKLWYDINFTNLDNDYKSGNVMGTELTATKTLGKWSFGVVGYGKEQVENDSGSAYNSYVAAGLAAPNGNRERDWALGPYVGYNFGPVIMDVWLDHSVTTKNTIGGDQFFTRLIIPL